MTLNNGQIRRKSPLATFERISPNSSRPRNKQIRRLSPHCVAGNLTIESTLGLSRFVTANPTGGASTSYAVGSDGRIGLGVEETNRPWTTSSAANDNEAITYEIANNGGAPDWRMSDAAINSFMNHAVETAMFYGFKKFNYQEKPANIRGSASVEAWIASWSKADEMLITLHCWYAAKACPGPYFIRQLPWIVKELNRRLNGAAPELFIGEGAVPSTPIGGEFKEYTIRITASALNVRKGPGVTHSVVKTLINDKNIYTVVEEVDGPGDNIGNNIRWGRLKSGAGWIALKFTDKR